MSVLRVIPARKIYRCDACGHEDFWGRDWRRYSSILLDDLCPDDVPHLCSADCEKAAQRKMNMGEWVLPKIRSDPAGGRVTKPGHGYGKFNTEIPR